MSAQQPYRGIKLALAVFACVFLCSFLLQASPAQADDEDKKPDYDPHTDEEFIPSTDDGDIPDTKSPVVGYNEYPMSHYDLDTYNPDDGGKKGTGNKVKQAVGFVTDVAGVISHPIQSAKDSVVGKGSKLLGKVQMFFVNISWKFYVILTHAGIAILTQAFTFGLIDHMLAQTGQVIKDLGSGVKFMMSFMLFLACCYLLFRFAKGQFRGVIGSVLVAALFTAGFSWYLTHATDFMRILNNNTNKVSTAILNSASYQIRESEAKSATGEGPEKREKAGDNEYLGVSKMRNVMHDLFIVKPYELMEFGTTDMQVIGGRDPDHPKPQDPTAEEQAAGDKVKAKGQKKMKAILKYKPGSKKRQKVVQKYGEKSIMWPAFLGQRGVIMIMVWIPAFFVVPILVTLAIMVQIYSLVFLVLSVMGVFMLFLAIFPPWQSFVMDWFQKILKTLAMKIGISVMLVLMFSFTNIAYQLSNGNLSLGYGATMLLIIIIFLAIFSFRKQMFGRATYDRGKGKVKRGAVVAGSLALGAATGGVGAAAAGATTEAGSGAAATRLGATGGKLGNAGRMMGGRTGQAAQTAQGAVNMHRQRKEKQAPIKEQKAQQKAENRQQKASEKAKRKQEKHNQNKKQSQNAGPKQHPGTQAGDSGPQQDAGTQTEQGGPRPYTRGEEGDKQSQQGQGSVHAKPGSEPERHQSNVGNGAIHTEYQKDGGNTSRTDAAPDQREPNVVAGNFNKRGGQQNRDYVQPGTGYQSRFRDKGDENTDVESSKSSGKRPFNAESRKDNEEGQGVLDKQPENRQEKEGDKP